MSRRGRQSPPEVIRRPPAHLELPETAREFQLYCEDRAAWAKIAAPRWRTMLQSADDAEKQRLWSLACPDLKAELRALAKETT